MCETLCAVLWAVKALPSAPQRAVRTRTRAFSAFELNELDELNSILIHSSPR